MNLPIGESRSFARTLFGAIVAAALAVTLIAPVSVLAQETTSAIRGRVVDASGQAVANAKVTVVDTRTGSARTYTTNSSGVFLAARLAVGGPYKVQVRNQKEIIVESIALGDTFSVTIDLPASANIEEVLVTGAALSQVEVAPGPSATFSSADLDSAVAFDRDIVNVYSIDPRLNLDNEDDGYEINCAGKHPRFNSVTLDGVSQNDRFGLNSNGYSTATGMPFPYDAIEQVAVELAPFDVTYGGFSACNINSVTKSGGNEWTGNVFFEWTSDDLRGDEIGGTSEDFTTPGYNEKIKGFSVGGPIMKDRLFFFAAYEDSEEPRFLARGFAGEGNGNDREWFSQADYNRIVDIANNVYGYDPGGSPGDGTQENEKYMLRVDWNINDNHNAALIYNYFDGFQDRDSDGDDDEFEFANHFYRKGAESETLTLKVDSQWTDALSTQLFYSTNEMNDSQVTVGPPDFGDFQIEVDGNTVYLGADDSRQANRLGTESEFLKLSGQYLAGNHLITAGYEREDLNIFNIFVQHSRGGEYDFFDDSAGNPAFCATLTAQGRFADPMCGMSGIDKFELGRPSRIYYGSGGGTNNPLDAAADFSNVLHSFYLQDEFVLDEQNLTITAGLRYDRFTSDDRPSFNQAFADANGGLRNDANLDGVSLLQPRIGFTWIPRDDLSVRGGIGRYSGGNPNVWISNAWSNDGITNVQLQLRNFDGSRTVLDPMSIAYTGQGRPGYDTPQELFDEVATTTAADASDENLVLIDPDYDQPSEWKFALGATWDTPWYDIVADVDVLFSRTVDSAYYVDVSQDVVGTTAAGAPIYNYVRGEDNFMLTNSGNDASSKIFSFALQKSFDWGLDLMFGYAYTDAEDISPMTSSVAFSNFTNLATLDINNPSAATSNYETPHRLTFRGIYSNAFFGDYMTRVSLYGSAGEGQAQSYVMDTRDLEGTRSRRHLLYVPTGPGDPNVVFATPQVEQEFMAFVAREGLGGGFQERNAHNARWSTRFDLRIDQEFPTFGERVRGRAFLKIYNLGNFLNKDWGKVRDAAFFSRDVVDADVDAQGRYVYTNFSDRSIEDLLENRTLWEARLGVELSF